MERLVGQSVGTSLRELYEQNEDKDLYFTYDPKH